MKIQAHFKQDQDIHLFYKKLIVNNYIQLKLLIDLLLIFKKIQVSKKKIICIFCYVYILKVLIIIIYFAKTKNLYDILKFFIINYFKLFYKKQI